MGRGRKKARAVPLGSLARKGERVGVRGIEGRDKLFSNYPPYPYAPRLPRPPPFLFKEREEAVEKPAALG